MQTLKTYLYDNILEVQFLDPSVFTTRNRIVYSRPIKVYQGIDNPLQIVIKNQDQKAVDVSAYRIQMDIQDPNHAGTVAGLAVTLVDAARGLGTVTIVKSLVDSLDQRFYKLTFRTIGAINNQEKPMYIDDNYGVPIDLEVLPAYYSDMVAPAIPADGIIDLGTL